MQAIDRDEDVIKARADLMDFYHSEITAHTTNMATFIIVIFTLIQVRDYLIPIKWKFILDGLVVSFNLFSLLLSFLIAVELYLLLRLLFWSKLGFWLLVTKPLNPQSAKLESDRVEEDKKYEMWLLSKEGRDLAECGGGTEYGLHYRLHQAALKKMEYKEP